MNFMYLSEEDMIKAGVKDMSHCVDTMEDTFRLLHQGDYRLGGEHNSDHGLRTRFPKSSNIKGMPIDAPGRWFVAMPAYLGGKYHCFGFKTYGANQDNYKRGIPRSILMMQLLDVLTGAPLAYMSANILSAMRTGGVSGLFARKFAVPSAKKVAVIGPGVIGRYSLDGVLNECKRVERICFLGIKDDPSCAIFKQHCKDNGYPDVEECFSISQACKNADVIITATTQASRFCDYPLIESKDIKQGACIIVTSAVRIERDYLNKLDHNFAFVSDDKRMYMGNRGIDVEPQTEEEKKTVTVKSALGELLDKGESVLNLPEVVSDASFSREPEMTYICASGGIPIEDVAWAYEC